MDGPTGTDHLLMFGIGGNNIDIHFDDISIIKQGCANQYRLDNSFAEELEEENFAIQYNNPFNSFLNLVINNSEQDEMSIYLYNSVGKMVLEQNAKTEEQIEIPTSKLTPGIYLIKISDGFKSQTYKLIKQ